MNKYPENDWRNYFIHSDESMKYGLPEKKKYPMPDRDHVMSAIKFFNYVSPSDEKELARNIIARIKEYGITGIIVGEKNRFGKYYKPEQYLQHHGVKGQKWGIQNGPPYPLDYNDHSAVEKKYMSSKLNESFNKADERAKKKFAKEVNKIIKRYSSGDAFSDSIKRIIALRENKLIQSQVDSETKYHNSKMYINNIDAYRPEKSLVYKKYLSDKSERLLGKHGSDQAKKLVADAIDNATGKQLGMLEYNAAQSKVDQLRKRISGSAEYGIGDNSELMKEYADAKSELQKAKSDYKYNMRKAISQHERSKK